MQQWPNKKQNDFYRPELREQEENDLGLQKSQFIDFHITKQYSKVSMWGKQAY